RYAAPGAVEPPKALPQAIERRRLRNERVQIDIHAGFDASGRDQDERPAQRALFAIRPDARPDRLQLLNQIVPIYRARRPDHQDNLGSPFACAVVLGSVRELLLELLEHGARPAYAVRDDADRWSHRAILGVFEMRKRL